LKPTVLLVDDDPDVLLAASLALRDAGVELRQARSPEAALAQLEAMDGAGGDRAVMAPGISLVLLDLNFRRGEMRGAEGLACLAQIRARHPQTSVVVVTAHAAVDLAVQALQAGAMDFISKPWSNQRLATTVANAVALDQARRQAEQLAAQASELGQPSALSTQGLIGRSPGIAHVRALIERVAPTDANVLILGENGVGKELVALAVHRASQRARQPLVLVDVGAVPATLFESELFGHKRGAFTDASRDRVGRIAAADGGTLFLDEIGNLPLALQPKLLAVLERRELTPVGSNTPRDVDVRVVSATNLPRDALADERQFRPDLLFRLNTVEIHVPPLRQRREDIPLLANAFVEHYGRKHHKPLRAFSEAALRAMVAHDWPGNVRALRHAVERAVVLGTSEARIGPDELALPERTPKVVARSRDDSGTGTGAAQGAPDADDLNLDRAERQLVERALVRNAWNISLAARDLGLTRASLYRRMQRHGL
jgi:DNA-binding NtrC family response regulator